MPAARVVAGVVLASVVAACGLGVVRAGKDVALDDGPMAGFVAYVADDALYLLSGDEQQVDELLAGLP
jgi:hypothetical protein